MFMTVLTRARHLSLCWIRYIILVQGPPHPHFFLQIHFNITLPSTSMFSEWLISFRITTKTLHAVTVCTQFATCPSRLFLLHLTNAKLSDKRQELPVMRVPVTPRQSCRIFLLRRQHFPLHPDNETSRSMLSPSRDSSRIEFVFFNTNLALGLQSNWNPPQQSFCITIAQFVSGTSCCVSVTWTDSSSVSLNNNCLY
jgi:hypothetical protein